MSHSPRLVVTPSAGCFHCGLPVPPSAPYPIQYEYQIQQTCCAGCQAVAQTIIDSGQGAYYVHRTALPVTPRQIEAELAKLGLDVATSRNLYDLPEIQQSFVRVEDEHIREAALMLETLSARRVCVAERAAHCRIAWRAIGGHQLRDPARSQRMKRAGHASYKAPRGV